jgi:hypothetical protein
MAFRINRGIFQFLDGTRFINKFKIGTDGQLKEVDADGNPVADYLKTGDKASDANTLDGIDSSAFLRSNANDTFTGTLTMGKQHALVANNYGRGVYGTYSATRYQHVWGMGTAYNLADDGTGTGNLYGIAWTHQNIGGESISGLGHQMLIMSNGDTRSAIGDGIWTKYNIYASGGDSTQWNAAYSWGNHAGLYLGASAKAADSNLLDGVNSTSFLRSDTADSASARIDFTADESIRLKGARGQFDNEYIHLYSKVGVGHPGGWGQGEGDTPNQGLSTYGGLNIAYGNNGGSTFNGAVDVNADFNVRNGRILITNPSGTGGGNFDPTTLAYTAREQTYGRAQLLLASGYSDITIGSSQANDNHGSTLTFATVNPSNGADYRKFVIGQGNWGARSGHLDFGYDAGSESKNPHSYINSTDVVFTIDADDNRVGINSMNPSHSLDVNGDAHISSTLEVDGRIYADNGLHVRGDWVRVNGTNGLYFESYGGGWYMTDSSWIRAYNNKAIYTGGNIEVGGTSRADNGFKVGGDTVIDSNRNITANASVQIGAYVMRHNTENNRLEFVLA